MNDSLDPDTLRLLDKMGEVHIETRRLEGDPGHRTIIWVVVMDGMVFVRSVRGPRGRWYKEVLANPAAALHAGDRRIPVRAVLEHDEVIIRQVSEAIRDKYEHASPGPTRAMVRPEVLPTTLRLEPA